MKPAAAPLEVTGQKVLPEWIDYNGHMNVAFYVLAMDHALDEVFDRFDIGPRYVASGAGSFFVTENHVHYLQEVMVDDPLRFTWQLLDCDEKRLHYVVTMFHAAKGYRAAVAEQMAVHVDLKTRRSSPMPAAVVRRLSALVQEHRALPAPAEVGRPAAIRRRA